MIEPLALGALPPDTNPHTSQRYSTINMADVHHPQRHRPAPILAPSGPTTERGALLSGLRTARPHSAAPTPQLVAFQQQQQNYIRLLEHQQQLLHQSQMILHAQQQQNDADAQRAMRRRSAQDSMPRGITPDQAERFVEARWRMQQDAAAAAAAQAHAQTQSQAAARFGPTLVAREETEESVKGNPLAASALARRKRQSLTMPIEGPQLPATPTQPTARRVSDSATHHRRTSSSNASAQSLISDARPVYTPPRLSPTLSDPPALILSKPGEAFPSTSSSSDGSQPATPARTESPTAKLRARRFSVSTRTKADHAHSASTDSASSHGSSAAEPASSIKPWLAGVSEAGPASPMDDGPTRRPSQAGSLAAALSGRRQRPAPVDTAHGSFFPQQQQRSVSDSSALSPFATTFQPLPASPFTPSYDLRTPTSARAPVAPAYGTATPIRQPRGPAVEAELSSSNFATRLRKKAISRLGVGRISLGGAA